MKKVFLFFSALVFCANQVVAAGQTQTVDVVNSTNQRNQTSQNQSDSLNSDSASEVTMQADDDADYSSNAGDNAAIADMVIDAAAILVGLTLGTTLQTTKQVLTLGTVPWTPGIATDIVSVISSLAHAAVNYFMRDTWYITADFTGVQGHVTDKWVGEPEKNKTISILADFNVPTQRFATIAFDSSEYKNLKDESNASARELMEYRNEKLVEEQRSLENVVEGTWGLRYRAQQRAINALATALQMKDQLAVLAEADTRITAEYGSKTQAVSTVAARRVLYDALMYLKMNVLAARTKTRAEAMELDFKAVTADPTGGDVGETNK